MKAWVIKPDGAQSEIALTYDQGIAIAKAHLGNVLLGLTRVRYQDRTCSMAFDDAAYEKALPVNVVATAAYRNFNTRRGGLAIRGAVMIFSGVLP